MQASEPGPESAPVRFEATIHQGPSRMALERVADFDLDRVPDPDGAVRVLISTEDAAELVAQGFEVHLLAALGVQPLDPKLVTDDKSARAWLEERTKGIPREGDS